jgi:hypothetical protein
MRYNGSDKTNLEVPKETIQNIKLQIKLAI